MIRFSFRQLTYFVAAAQEGSTLRAAEALNVSQPAVSVAISDLESTFGQKLFVRRHAQGMVLTPYGRRKLAEVRQLLVHANAISGSDEDGSLSGDLELGVFSTLAPAFAPGLMRAFAALHPNVRVHMREENLDQIQSDLTGGIIELALLYDLDTINEIERIPLADFQPYVLLREGHPLAKRGKVSLIQLAAEPFVLIDLPHSREYFLSLFRMAGVMPANLIRCVSIETVRGLVANGFGVSILITHPYGEHAYDGRRLTYRPLAENVPPQRAIIGYSSNAPRTRLADAFVAVAQHYFANLPVSKPPSRNRK